MTDIVFRFFSGEGFQSPIHDNPLLSGSVDARSFDDEGVPCSKHLLVEKGVLKDYIVDIVFATREPEA